MHSVVNFPEMLHRGSSVVSGLCFAGEVVGGWGVVRVWVSLRCCMMAADRSSSGMSQSGHDQGCGLPCSSSPE